MTRGWTCIHYVRYVYDNQLHVLYSKIRLRLLEIYRNSNHQQSTPSMSWIGGNSTSFAEHFWRL